MKYRLTDSGARECACRFLKRRLSFSIEDKVFKILRSGVAYDIDSLYSMIADDKTVKEWVTIGKITSIINTLIDRGYVVPISETPIGAIGGMAKWQNSQQIN